ncbi:MAG: polysaccharide deacetylase family protein [Candidatus Hodarchaeota archaeon]
METTVFFTLDVDPSFPWRSDIQGLKEFLNYLRYVRYKTDFVCEMNITGYALIQISKASQPLLDQLRGLIKAKVIEIGNHGYSHRPLCPTETNFNLGRYMKGRNIFRYLNTVIRNPQTTSNIKNSLHYAMNLFLKKPKLLDKKEIIKEVNMTNKLIEGVFGNPPEAFRAPFFSTSQEVSEVIREEGIRYDLSSYIRAKGNKLQAVIPRIVREGKGRIYEIATSAKLDPEPWIENIATYKPGLLPPGLTVIVVHPWEFSFAYTQSNTVKQRFSQLLKETDRFVLSEEAVKL